MRIATYNVEWFNALFDMDGALLEDDGPSGRHGVKRMDQLAALGIVFTALDADAVMVIEAPGHNRRQATCPALENFARLMKLRARRAITGFETDTQQEIALLYDPDTLTLRHDPKGAPVDAADAEAAPRFDTAFRIDLDIDATEDRVTFSKPPLELNVATVAGTALRMIGAHLKSKAPRGGGTRDAVMRQSIANRRKQLAQAGWLRKRIDEHLVVGEPLIVLGDLNDGPGLDEYEHLFGRSSIEIIMGEGRPGAMRLYDPNAQRALTRRVGPIRTTARFYRPEEGDFIQALLDYILISPDLMGRAPRWRIWHPLDDPGCWRVPELRDALIAASDHFPVTLDIDL